MMCTSDGSTALHSYQIGQCHDHYPWLMHQLVECYQQASLPRRQVLEAIVGARMAYHCVYRLTYWLKSVQSDTRYKWMTENDKSKKSAARRLSNDRALSSASDTENTSFYTVLRGCLLHLLYAFKTCKHEMSRGMKFFYEIQQSTD